MTILQAFGAISFYKWDRNHFKAHLAGYRKLEYRETECIFYPFFQGLVFMLVTGKNNGFHSKSTDGNALNCYKHITFSLDNVFRSSSSVQACRHPREAPWLQMGGGPCGLTSRCDPWPHGPQHSCSWEVPRALPSVRRFPFSRVRGNSR